MDITPFAPTIDSAAIEDLRRRLSATRWATQETVDDWSQGMPLAYLQDLCAYWANDYDFGLAERVRRFPNFRTTLAGGGSEPLEIHFLHARSPEPDAFPLVLTHGWPGSVVEFFDVLGPLTDPAAHGGDPSDAFHVVAPSLPGYGWSAKPTRPGWGVSRIADAWDELMLGLGYVRYGAQGGDWGSMITTTLAQAHPEHLAGIHVNMVNVGPDRTTLDDLTADEQRALAAMEEHRRTGIGYSTQQSSRPQTLGYGLNDSPVGQAAWIAEKFWAWCDHNGTPDSALSREQMLDDISLYWFTQTATSSARLYWESFGDAPKANITVPSGISNFPGEIWRPSRRWAERRFTDLRWYEDLPRGGHFAAWEQPELFVDQIRGFFRLVR
ncbi:epoxide hydrolase family protein [Cumulibacter soli]|uniref:epoxide hydrolase family protein n=1 Tax=Cumulibacter soli TaxID=2546344 RepID=UPI0010672351|nr:epoxide hydrolase family protein [Cumulibacter soli]